MTEHAPGGETHDQDQVGITEKIHRNAAQHGADLTVPLSLAGFLGSAAAVLAHANARLPEPERLTHAQAILELIDAVAVEAPQFNTGWDAMLAVHSSMIRNAVKAGTLTAQTEAVLLDTAARLLHDS